MKPGREYTLQERAVFLEGSDFAPIVVEMSFVNQALTGEIPCCGTLTEPVAHRLQAMFYKI